MDSGRFVKEVVKAYAKNADPHRAIPMAKYMLNQFDYYGIPSPERKPIVKELIVGRQPSSQADIAKIVRMLWDKPQRELQYFAVEFIRRNAKSINASFIATTKFMITNKSWWDTVDEIAAHIVGPLVLENPKLVKTMDDWAGHKNLWLARTAIIHQNSYKNDTNLTQLFDYCLLRADETNFFIRKAIGWSLREAAKTKPREIRRFVKTHADELSPLSVREALKHL